MIRPTKAEAFTVTLTETYSVKFTRQSQTKRDFNAPPPLGGVA